MKSPLPEMDIIQGVHAAPPDVAEHSASSMEKSPTKDGLEEISTLPVDINASETHERDGAFEEDSPYEEVRAAVRNTDGEEIANTLRAWILGTFFVTIAAALNMFLSMR